MLSRQDMAFVWFATMFTAGIASASPRNVVVMFGFVGAVGYLLFAFFGSAPDEEEEVGTGRKPLSEEHLEHIRIQIRECKHHVRYTDPDGSRWCAACGVELPSARRK